MSVQTKEVLQRGLEASDARFQAIVEQCADGILVVGDDLTIRFVNQQAAVMLGRTCAQLRGNRLEISIAKDVATEIDYLAWLNRRRREVRIDAYSKFNSPEQVVQHALDRRKRGPASWGWPRPAAAASASPRATRGPACSGASSPASTLWDGSFMACRSALIGVLPDKTEVDASAPSETVMPPNGRYVNLSTRATFSRPSPP